MIKKYEADNNYQLPSPTNSKLWDVDNIDTKYIIKLSKILVDHSKTYAIKDKKYGNLKMWLIFSAYFIQTYLYNHFEPNQDKYREERVKKIRKYYNELINNDEIL